MNVTNNDTNFPIFMSSVLKQPPPQHQQQQYQEQQYQQQQYQQQHHNPQNIDNRNKRQKEQENNRRIRSRTDAKATHATTIPSFWTGIVKKYNAERIRIPKTNEVHTHLNFETNAPFAQAIGINGNDCINYCIKGECWLHNCKRDHPATISPNENVLTPAYTALFNDLKSKK